MIKTQMENIMIEEYHKRFLFSYIVLREKIIRYVVPQKTIEESTSLVTN
jgi:hypothetical protein